MYRDTHYYSITLLLLIQAIKDQFPEENIRGELVHKIHTQRLSLNEPHLQLMYSTNDKDLCDVAVSNEGKVFLACNGFVRVYMYC